MATRFAGCRDDRRQCGRTEPAGNGDERRPMVHVAAVQYSAVLFDCADERLKVSPCAGRSRRRGLNGPAPREEDFEIVQASEDVLPGLQNRYVSGHSRLAELASQLRCVS
jgi:hypothetical protein